MLGGGFYATRLYHDLRQVAGYVYNVDVSLSASKTRATYSVDYGCDPDKVSKARALIERDLNQMRTENVSDAELHQAKALPAGDRSRWANLQKKRWLEACWRVRRWGFRSTSLCGRQRRMLG